MMQYDLKSEDLNGDEFILDHDEFDLPHEVPGQMSAATRPIVEFIIYFVQHSPDANIYTTLEWYVVGGRPRQVLTRL